MSIQPILWGWFDILCTESQRHLSYSQSNAAFRCPLHSHSAECIFNSHMGCMNSDVRKDSGGVKTACSPSPPTLKFNDLNGSEPACPCRGGAPGLKKLVKLEPTFHTRTSPSSRETVINRLPSGEKLHAAGLFLWPSRTYNRVAVFKSYIITAPSLVPTAKRWLFMWKSTVGKLSNIIINNPGQYNTIKAYVLTTCPRISVAVSRTASRLEVELGSRDFTTASTNRGRLG